VEFVHKDSVFQTTASACGEIRMTGLTDFDDRFTLAEAALYFWQHRFEPSEKDAVRTITDPQPNDRRSARNSEAASDEIFVLGHNRPLTSRSETPNAAIIGVTQTNVPNRSGR
jgi:hypothetical protein